MWKQTLNIYTYVKVEERQIIDNYILYFTTFWVQKLNICKTRKWKPNNNWTIMSDKTQILYSMAGGTSKYLLKKNWGGAVNIYLEWKHMNLLYGLLAVPPTVSTFWTADSSAGGSEWTLQVHQHASTLDSRHSVSNESECTLKGQQHASTLDIKPGGGGLDLFFSWGVRPRTSPP